MTVLHLNTEKGWRGGEQQLAYLVGELRNHGVNNVVVARRKSLVERWCQNNSIQVFSLRAGGLKIGPALMVKRLARKMKANLIHAHSPNAHTVSVLSATLGSEIPIVVSRRVAFPPKTTSFTRWKYNHQSIRKIICVSHYVENLIKDYVDAPEKVITVFDGVDLHRFVSRQENMLRNELRISENVALIGNIGALDTSKDYYTFILTIRRLLDTGHKVHGVIIGAGPQMEELTKFASDTCGEHITFTGHRNDISDVLPCLDVFLFTSRAEGLGTSVLDAFAARTPVVATAAGGIPEMVVHQQTGWLAAVGDADYLAEGVAKTLMDQEFRERIIRNAALELERFGKEVMALNTLAVYEAVIRNGQARGK